MKVFTQLIPENAEEEVRLLLHKETPELSVLKEYIEEERYRPQFLLCYKEKELCRIHFSSVFYIESVQEIQYVHTKQEVYTTKQRLYVLERELPENFVRVSKSALLNMEQVERYKPLTGGLMFAIFPSGDGTYISRKYVKDLRERIRKG